MIMSYKAIVDHYENCYKQHGDSHLGVDWPDKTDADTRYRIMTEGVEYCGGDSILDFGCGKGTLYTKDFNTITNYINQPVHKHWNLDSYTLYDAGYKKHSKYPTGIYDAVICTDVIEHIWKDDLYWFTKELCSFAKKLVFINVACYAAKKTFTDGTNVHVSVYPPPDWVNFFQTIKEEFPLLDFYIVTQHQEMKTNGILLRKKKKGN